MMPQTTASQPPSPTTQQKKKGNGLAIAALVLSSVFFLPIIPFFGLVLGIVALTTGRSKPMSIVAICLGGFFTLMTGVYAAVAVPAFMKYIRRSKTVEATMNTRTLADAVMRLDAAAWSKLAESDWTPAASACGQPGDRYAADASAFSGEPWATLGFSVAEPHYYQYRLRRDAGGFVVEARGDLD
ncbi:MAG TPA: DUF4190 domain-containing protein, partial [Polyangia bacterium]